MKKVVLIDSGKNPEDFSFNFLPMARTKTKCDLDISSKITVNEKVFNSVLPIITMYSDNLILDVDANGNATKYNSVYDLKLKKDSILNDDELKLIEKDLKEFTNIKYTSKLDLKGNIIEAKVEGDSSQPSELADNINNISTHTQITLPDEPIGESAVWVVYETDIPTVIGNKFNLTNIFKLIKRNGSNAEIEILSKIDSNKEQLKSFRSVESELLEYKGNSLASVKLDLMTGEKEGFMDSILDMKAKILYGIDSGKVIHTTQSTYFSSEYIG